MEVRLEEYNLSLSYTQVAHTLQLDYIGVSCNCICQAPIALRDTEFGKSDPLHLQVQSSKLLDQYFFGLPEFEQKYVKEGANKAVMKERLLARTLVRSVLTRWAGTCLSLCSCSTMVAF